MQGLFIYHVPVISETGQYRVSVTVNPAHEILRAHFPGQPVVPGITIMRLFRDIAAEMTGRSLELEQAGEVKFIKAVTPEFFSGLQALCTLEKNGEKIVLHGELRYGEEIMTKLEGLIYA